MQVCRYLFVCVLLSVTAGLGAADDPKVRSQMEAFAGKGITEALKVITEHGSIYPFAMLLDKDNNVRIVAYSGERLLQPPPDQFMPTLVQRTREAVKESSDISAAAIVRMHTITNKKGEQISGVWLLLDHRQTSPWIIFQPLVPSTEPGHYSLGEQIIEPARQPLFDPSK